MNLTRLTIDAKKAIPSIFDGLDVLVGWMVVKFLVCSDNLRHLRDRGLGGAQIDRAGIAQRMQYEAGRESCIAL